MTDVDVEKSIPVHISHGGAGGPPFCPAAYPSVLRDVVELKAASVEIEAIRTHICGEKDIGEPVVVDVPHRHTSAVVEIEIIDAVEEGFFLKTVLKGDACFPWRKLLKEGWGGIFEGTANREENYPD